MWSGMITYLPTIQLVADLQALRIISWHSGEARNGLRFSVQTVMKIITEAFDLSSLWTGCFAGLERIGISFVKFPIQRKVAHSIIFAQVIIPRQATVERKLGLQKRLSGNSGMEGRASARPQPRATGRNTAERKLGPPKAPLRQLWNGGTSFRSPETPQQDATVERKLGLQKRTHEVQQLSLVMNREKRSDILQLNAFTQASQSNRHAGNENCAEDKMPFSIKYHVRHSSPRT